MAGYSEHNIVLLGDDDVIVLRGLLCEREKRRLTAFFREFCTDLGFSVKVKCSHYWHEVEFCSSLFWPVQGGYVLGPKPGRQLVKMGFSLKKLDPEQIKGLMLGWKLQAGFLPLFGVYVRHMLKGMSSVANGGYVDPDAKYKINMTRQHVASEETYLFFYERYGCCGHYADESLKQCLAGAGTTTMVDWPLLDVFLDVDV
jgi:hypothetical protein